MCVCVCDVKKKEFSESGGIYCVVLVADITLKICEAASEI